MRELSLLDAQLVVAREYGFSSWSKLKAHIEAVAGLTPVTKLALLAAANRALETEREAPLFRDPLARALAGDTGMTLAATMRPARWPPNHGGPDAFASIRTRFFDDALLGAVRERSLLQVVVLGAGMDARAFRLGWPGGVVLFEVDRDDVLARKGAALKRLQAQPACDRRVARFEGRGALAAALERAGFDRRRPAAFLLERQLHYSTEAAVGRLFRMLEAAAAPESWLGVELLSKRTLTSPFMRPFLDKLDELGYPPWRFAVDEPEAFLHAHGWDGRVVVAGAPEVSYGRWPYAYIPRSVPDIAVPRIYLARAVRLGGVVSIPVT